MLGSVGMEIAASDFYKSPSAVFVKYEKETTNRNSTRQMEWVEFLKGSAKGMTSSLPLPSLLILFV